MWTPIRKNPDSWKITPNMPDYDSAAAGFSWEAARAGLQGLPEGRGLNIAHEAVDRHAQGNSGERVALRWPGSEGGASRAFTYAELKSRSNRFANVLEGLGIGRGDTVAVLAGRIPDLYIAALGILKNRSVFCPLFSAFGPEPIFQRLSRGDARVLLTTERAFRQKVKPLLDRLPMLGHVLLIDAPEHAAPENAAFQNAVSEHAAPEHAASEHAVPEHEQAGKRVLSLPRLMDQASDAWLIPPTDPEDIALLHFTSGTTGMPKGALHAHGAVLAHYATGSFVLDFHPGDIFWCTADPGWVTGTSYGIIAPLLHGITSVIDEDDFDALRWCRILASEKVTVWYTAPTAIRRFMRMGLEPARDFELSSLRLVHSVGEPLNPEAVTWGMKALGAPIHDNWWQTETGAIMIANFPALEIRPGSMGRPIPGIEAAIVRRLGQNRVEVIEAPGVPGELALRRGWPSMFRGYLHDEARYRECFAGGWYLTGDLARRDADGWFWFVGRADDLIKTSGHLVGPFEIESTLMEHPAVAEAGVIGKPDPLVGEIVKAFISLKPGFTAGEALRLELIGFARKRLGPAVAPREIDFRQDLPRNKAGKILRRLLKARELGLPEGDLSTVEDTGS